MARQPEHLVDQQRRLGRYLAALREAAGLCQPDIARAVPCHRTTVTHAEAGSQLPASDFWETADRLVGANGALVARYDELIQAKAAHLADQQAKRRARAQATAQQLTAGLARSSDETKARFAAATHAEVPEHETAQPSAPLAQSAMLPVVVNGRLVLMPFGADALADTGFNALLDELATTGAAGGSAFAASEEVQKWGVAAAVSSDLWQTATAITLGVGQADLDLDRLDRLIPRLDADEPPRQVGVADVDAIESTTDALRRRDYAHGGGPTYCLQDRERSSTLLPEVPLPDDWTNTWNATRVAGAG
ncbi:MAG: helix-turn-helix domain-containing protein [Pseudonocardiaceae bacterium]